MTNHEQEEVLREHPGQETIECKVCLKEVPASAAQNAECEDYVFYFCGSECFDKWEHQQGSNNQSSGDK